MFKHTYIHVAAWLHIRAVHHIFVCKCKSSKMAHFVFKCNKEDYLSVCKCMRTSGSRSIDKKGTSCSTTV